MRWRLGGVFVVACAILLCTGCGSGELGTKGLAEQSKAVQSLAAEGALLAEDSAAGKSTGVYRREHAADLSKAAATAEASLQKARTTTALEPKLRELAAIAARVRADLGRLGGASEGEQRTLGRALETAAHASERIGTELG
jgi:hypothetical protein